jgi:hydantoinase/carbamoylase family amidase
MIGDLTDAHLRAECHFTGRSLADVMSDFGLDPTRVAEAERAEGSVSAVVELHVEQGPFLEEASVPIGIVTSIAGNWRLPISIRGQQSHSGATPMARRRDALTAGAEVILAAERTARNAQPEVVATCGYFGHEPKVIAIVPGRAEMTMDVRSPDADALNAAKDDILAAVQDVCRRRGVDLSVGELWGVQPTPTDASVADTIENAARALGVASVRMPSWAGHDSMMLGKRFPAGVIFVPSIGGISHAPTEYSTPESIHTGARVLGATVAGLADAT